MRVTVPDFFDEFQCLAGACPHTCCEKWEVVIDEDTACRYFDAPGTLGDRLRSALQVDEAGGFCFPLDGGRCPFLDGDNLCEIHKELGKAATSVTCREHPRFTEDYGSFREITLSASCPAANALLLGSEAPLTFRTFETEEAENIPGPPQQPSEAGAVGRGGTRLRPQAGVEANRPAGRHLGEDELAQFSPQGETEQSGLKVNCPAGAREAPLGDCDDEDEWLAYLLPLRRRLLDILRDRALSLRRRLGDFLLLAGEAQLYLEEEREAELPALAASWTPSERAEEDGGSLLFPYTLRFLTSLEVLDPDWPAILKRAEAAEPGTAPEELLERTAVYFAFRYLLKAVNDGDLLGRAELCVLAVLVIEKLAAVCEGFPSRPGETVVMGRGGARKRKEETPKDGPDRSGLCADEGLAEALRRFSCEIEHDEGNLDALLEAFRREEAFSLRQFLAALEG